MKKIPVFFVCVLLTAMFAGCNKTTPVNESTASPENSVEATDTAGADASAGSEATDAQNTEYLTGLHHVEIEVKDYGTIKCELDADTAPITVTNFIDLAKSGFYDGLTFHRIIDGFMIQGGDPLGNGTGGSDETIKGEFSDNDVENDISHVRGTISMARATANDSASSQFFIVQQDSTSLDGKYAAFGHVTDGMDVVDALCKDVAGWNADENGIIPAENQPVITSVTVVD